MMEPAASQTWFLRKHEDGSLFGPLPFEQVQRWAGSAQIAPHDKLSHDRETWLKAPMFPELEMDWLVEVTSDRYYGPTTLGALREFVRLGEISEETFVINSCDGSRRQIREIAGLELLPNEQRTALERDDEESAQAAPATSTMSINLHDRINDLEQSLAEERRALRECEARYGELKERYHELLRSSVSVAASELEP